MALTKYKLGELIEQRREKYDGISNLPIRGVSREGFINAKQPDADKSLYNTFYKYDFVFNPARMEINSIALNIDYEKAICSSLYEIFFVKEKNIILPEYLNLFIKRDEFARLCEFIGWGSAREYCRVGDISDIEISLPPLSVQQKYVNIYNAMLENQHCYERGLEDLKLSIDALLDRFKKKSQRQFVANLLEEVDVRNSDNSYNEVFGVNITKQFMPSVASSKDVHNYKIVSKNQFVYSGMQTGRDECIRIALLDKDTPLIVSPAYSVLQVKNDEVMPEFIQMWFSRSEMDRLGWFMSDSSIRSNLDLPRFFEIEIPVPTKEEQNALVNIYKAYTIRRTINERLKEQIKKLCPVLIKGSLEEGEK